VEQCHVSIEPWRGAKADSVDLKDLQFFFTRRTLVQKAFHDDRQVRDVKQRWFYMDFGEEIAALDGSTVSDNGQALGDILHTVTDDNFAPIPDFENFEDSEFV
jgi:hypothetical protein